MASSPTEAAAGYRRSPLAVLGRLLKYLGIALAVLVGVAVLGLLVFQRVSDGPAEMIQGGPFTSGVPVSEPFDDWAGLPPDAVSGLEFELIGAGTARKTGGLIYQDELYIACDLGYIWARMEGRTRLILNTIYVFKRWHEDAEEDGRTLLRMAGKVYPGHLERIVDPAQYAALRSHLDQLAAEYFGGELPPPPAEPPNDVWFFKFRSDPTVAAGREFAAP